MTPHVLQRLFSFTHGVVRRNVDGIDDDDSYRSPEPGGNCLNWVVGHIVATRAPILRSLGAEPVWTAEAATPYIRGSPALQRGHGTFPFPSILADLDESQQRILEKLATLSDAALATAPPADLNPFKAATLGESLAIAHFHESYHSGQTGLLRRILGREGAIR